MVEIKIVNEKKPFWESRTFWVAFVAVVVGTLTAIQGNLEAGISVTFMSVLMVVVLPTLGILGFREEIYILKTPVYYHHITV